MKTVDKKDGEKETCIWASIGLITRWRYTSPVIYEKNICTPFGSYYNREEVNHEFQRRTHLRGACTPVGCCEVRHDSDGSKEITIGTICCKTTSLVAPQQVSMTGTKN